MGVNTLLKHLSPCLEDSHVERFRGKTVAVDGNTFIFRGCYSCSEKQVALGVPCSGPVDHLLKRVHMLKHYGVKPWVVLDGRRTPMKDDTSKQRRQEREKNLCMAKNFRQRADDASCAAEKDALLQKAQTFFQKSIHVTRQMVTNAMSALKKEGVECMVAPYEADAQVAFLVRSNLASAVITEDSDILVYMAAVKSTASVLYKIDEFGKCKELGFDPQKLSSLPGEIGKFGRGLSAFAGEGGGRSFVQLAALAGCDYIDNVKGLGLMTALPIVPEGHRERMRLAEMSFFWHRVYDPRGKTCVHFCDAAPELIGTADVPDLPSTADGMAFLGEHIESGLMVKISCGKVDPVTGAAVTAEVFPTPGSGGGIRRSVTTPSTRPTSAPVPTTTPIWARNQQQQMQQMQQMQQAPGQNNSSGGRNPLPQQAGRKQYSQEWRGREAQDLSSKKHGAGGGDGGNGGGGGGGGGLLKDMFERARSKAEDDKENNPKYERDTEGLQDVSEIVIACRSGQTPARMGSSSRAPNTAAAVPNPFAKKLAAAASSATKTTAAVFSPGDFRTPCAPTAGGGVRSKGGAAHPRGYAGGDSDAWSRLSKGCMLASERAEGDSAPGQGGGVVLMDVGNQTEAGRGAKGLDGSQGNVCGGAEIVGVKRSLSTPSPRGNGGSDRRKKKAKFGGNGGRKSHTQPQCGAVKGVTILSFFGRAAASKP
ncbi:unnamed protein product [Pylaiella littoralis]